MKLICNCVCSRDFLSATWQLLTFAIAVFPLFAMSHFCVLRPRGIILVCLEGYCLRPCRNGFMSCEDLRNAMSFCITCLASHSIWSGQDYPHQAQTSTQRETHVGLTLNIWPAPWPIDFSSFGHIGLINVLIALLICDARQCLALKWFPLKCHVLTITWWPKRGLLLNTYTKVHWLCFTWSWMLGNSTHCVGVNVELFSLDNMVINSSHTDDVCSVTIFKLVSGYRFYAHWKYWYGLLEHELLCCQCLFCASIFH